MPLNADSLLERIHLKTQARRWRVAAIVIALLCVVLLTRDYLSVDRGLGLSGQHIARYTVEDVIFDDVDRHELLQEIVENDSVKALIVRIDTPGGTTVGSEQLYQDLREIAQNKPVVAVMRSLATSGGYLAAIGADYIIASEGTITGSVGVIMQSAEVTDMVKKLGITPVTLRSGDLKASPNPLEKTSRKAEKMLMSVINDFFEHFLNLVQTRRKMSDEDIKTIADGRIVSARQALELQMIDEIGGEKQAMLWLTDQHKIAKGVPVIDYETKEEEFPLQELFKNSISGFFPDQGILALDGLAAIWQPNILK